MNASTMVKQFPSGAYALLAHGGPVVFGVMAPRPHAGVGRKKIASVRVIAWEQEWIAPGAAMVATLASHEAAEGG
jgi:hypothetical protein